jgi:hypothetical protein
MHMEQSVLLVHGLDNSKLSCLRSSRGCYSFVGLQGIGGVQRSAMYV